MVALVFNKIVGGIVGSIVLLALLMIVVVAAYVAIPCIAAISAADWVRRWKWRGNAR